MQQRCLAVLGRQVPNLAEVQSALDISPKLMYKESLLIEVAAFLLFAHVHPRLSALPIPHPLACILNSMSTTRRSSFVPFGRDVGCGQCFDSHSPLTTWPSCD